ncbi:MAG TPA: Ku protein [Solirubrobacterales bacterium]|nr:Ku protein [Solirubrobacterales bacterium]
MARAIWTGSISFGLLNVPVKLYSAVSSRSISFRELREGDNSRIRHRRVAEEDGEEVPYEKIVKGYEIAPEQYVILERGELEELAPKKTKAIQIEAFVDLDEIDPIYFDRPYYVGPQMGAERAYALLVEAMREQRKVAISRFVMRNKESLAAIRATGDVLTLATMRFADEVVPPEQLDGLLGEETETEPNPKEVEMAKALIDSLASDFDPGAFKDEYREELLALIERKARGEDVVSVDAEAPQPTKAPDLMAALEESLAAVKAEDLGGAEKPAKKKPAAKKAARGKTTKSKAKSKSASKAKAAK